jgi:hypothetical protein
MVLVQFNRNRLGFSLSERKFMSRLVDLDHVRDLMLANLIHVEDVRGKLFSIYVYIPCPINVVRQT